MKLDQLSKNLILQAGVTNCAQKLKPYTKQHPYIEIFNQAKDTMKTCKEKTKLVLEKNGQVLENVNLLKLNFKNAYSHSLFKQNNKHWLETTEHQIIDKNGERCLHCLRNNLLPCGYEWSCPSCGWKYIKQKKEFTKIRKKH